MNKIVLIVFLLFSWNILVGQTCQDILNKSIATYKKGHLRLAWRQLQDAETCDHKNELEEERQNLQRQIFDAVEQAKLDAEKSDSSTTAALLKLKDKNKEFDLKNEQIKDTKIKNEYLVATSEFQKQISNAKLLIAVREYSAANQLLIDTNRKLHKADSLNSMDSLKMLLNIEIQKCDSLIIVQKKFENLMSEGDSLNKLGLCCKADTYEKYTKALDLIFFNEFAQAGMYETKMEVESKLLSREDRSIEGTKNPIWTSAEINLLEGDRKLAFKKLKDLERDFYSFYPHGTDNEVLKKEIEEIGINSRRFGFRAFFNYLTIIMDKAIWEGPSYTDKFSDGSAIGGGFTFSYRQKNFRTEAEASYIRQNKPWGNFENKDWLNHNTTINLNHVYSDYNLFAFSANQKLQLIPNFYAHKKKVSVDVGIGVGYYIIESNSVGDLLINLDDNSSNSKNSAVWNILAETKLRLSKKAPVFLLLEAKFSAPIKPRLYVVNDSSNTPPFNLEEHEVKYYFRNFSNRIGLFYAF